MLLAIGVTFAVALLLGVPVAIALGLSSLAGLLAWGMVSLLLLPQRMFTGVDVFVLMAIPFFVLAGELIVKAGILDRILHFVNSLVGHIQGGLAHVNIGASMIFAGISGSAVADASALGAVLIPSIEKEYKDKEFGAAVCAAAAIIGPIIPPSIPMIVYALASGKVSVAGLFLAGVIPGVLIGIGMMVISYFIAGRRGYPKRLSRPSFREIAVSFRHVLWALLMPLIIIGGILGGIFTPTEAAAVAVLYAMFVGFFVSRKLRWEHFPPAILRAGIVTSVVFLLVATANVASWLLTAQRLPFILADWLKTISPSPLLFLLFTNIFLLIVGCLLDNIAAIIMLVPVLEPMAQLYGIHPLHFAIVFVINNVIGMLTPPVGLVLFVTCGISGVSLERLVRRTWPFLLWQIAVLGIVTYFPGTALLIPRLFGYER